jgi:hypothetical protein
VNGSVGPTATGPGEIPNLSSLNGSEPRLGRMSSSSSLDATAYDVELFKFGSEQNSEFHLQGPELILSAT